MNVNDFFMRACDVLVSKVTPLLRFVESSKTTLPQRKVACRCKQWALQLLHRDCLSLDGDQGVGLVLHWIPWLVDLEAACLVRKRHVDGQLLHKFFDGHPGPHLPHNACDLVATHRIVELNGRQLALLTAGEVPHHRGPSLEDPWMHWITARWWL